MHLYTFSCGPKLADSLIGANFMAHGANSEEQSFMYQWQISLTLKADKVAPLVVMEIDGNSLCGTIFSRSNSV